MVDRWKIVEDVIGVLKTDGAISQDPYRAQLFELCRAAHDAGPTDGTPSLAADGLSDAIRARWPTATPRQLRQLDELNVTWRAWLYAFAQLFL
jgi:hypothetical protein